MQKFHRLIYAWICIILNIYLKAVKTHIFCISFFFIIIFIKEMKKTTSRNPSSGKQSHSRTSKYQTCLLFLGLSKLNVLFPHFYILWLQFRTFCCIKNILISYSQTKKENFFQKRVKQNAIFFSTIHTLLSAFCYVIYVTLRNIWNDPSERIGSRNPRVCHFVSSGCFSTSRSNSNRQPL